MSTWIGNKAYVGHAPPLSVRAVLDALGDLSTLAGVRSQEGGIRREVVLGALLERRMPTGLNGLQSPHLDALDRDHRIGLRVEAGRAYNNNDGVVAVLEAARHPEVDVLVLIVPAVYKGSSTVLRVEDQLRRLLSSTGIDLALTGVALKAY